MFVFFAGGGGCSWRGVASVAACHLCEGSGEGEGGREPDGANAVQAEDQKSPDDKAEREREIRKTQSESPAYAEQTRTEQNQTVTRAW